MCRSMRKKREKYNKVGLVVIVFVAASQFTWVGVRKDYVSQKGDQTLKTA